MLALLLAVAGTLTEAQVAEAIRYGEAAKESPLIVIAPAPAGWGIKVKGAKPPDVCGIASTPFLRVAHAAHRATVKYQKLTADQVAPADLAPELLVYGSPRGAHGRATSVAAIVVMPKGGKSKADAVQPMRAEPVDVEMSNAFGATAQAQALGAAFPLEVLQEGAEIRIVYESGFECSMKVKLKDWR